MELNEIDNNGGDNKLYEVCKVWFMVNGIISLILLKLYFKLIKLFNLWREGGDPSPGIGVPVFQRGGNHLPKFDIKYNKII